MKTEHNDTTQNRYAGLECVVTHSDFRADGCDFRGVWVSERKKKKKSETGNGKYDIDKTVQRSEYPNGS